MLSYSCFPVSSYVKNCLRDAKRVLLDNEESGLVPYWRCGLLSYRPMGVLSQIRAAGFGKKSTESIRFREARNHIKIDEREIRLRQSVLASIEIRAEEIGQKPTDENIDSEIEEINDRGSGNRE